MPIDRTRQTHKRLQPRCELHHRDTEGQLSSIRDSFATHASVGRSPRRHELMLAPAHPEAGMRPFKRRISDKAEGPATFIARAAEIRGSIKGSGAYVVCGSVDGDCDITGPVTLARDGRWRGELRADSVVIAGTVEGDVVAREKVEIAQTARVTGSISGHSIAVAEGAVIEGDLNVTSGNSATTFKERRKPAEPQ